MAAPIEVSVVLLSHCFVLFACCLTQFLKIFGFISFFYISTWSFENRVSEHFIIFLNLPRLIA